MSDHEPGTAVSHGANGYPKHRIAHEAAMRRSFYKLLIILNCRIFRDDHGIPEKLLLNGNRKV